MTILLKGYYGFGNLGDDILLKVSYILLKEKYPHAVFSVFSNNSINNKHTQTSSDYNLYIRELLGSNVEIIDWTYKGEFDLVFHGGGGVYGDRSFSLISAVLNIIISKLSIVSISRLDKMARKILKKPHRIIAHKRIGMGIGIGDYAIGASQLFNELAEIGTYDKLVVRDDYSINYLKSLKMPYERTERNTDLAFINSWNVEKQKIRFEIKKIGIVVKENLDDQLQDVLLDFYHNTVKKGYDVTLFSLDKIYDLQIAQKCQGLNYIAYEPFKIDSFLNQFNQQDLLITSRAHGAILGACMDIPSIVLNTEIKLGEVIKMFPNGCLSVDQWDLLRLESSFQQMVMNYQEIIKGLKKDVAEHQLTATQLIEYLP